MVLHAVDFSDCFYSFEVTAQGLGVNDRASCFFTSTHTGALDDLGDGHEVAEEVPQHHALVGDVLEDVFSYFVRRHGMAVFK